MHRRALLHRIVAGAIALPAGCLDPGRAGQGSNSEGATGATTTPHTESATATPRTVDGTPRSTTGTPTAGSPKRVAVDGLHDGELRSELDVAATATLVEPRVTGAHTARVRLRLANRGVGDRTVSYRAEECDLNVLSGRRGDGGARLLLVPADANWTPAAEDCWRVPPPNLSCGIPATTHEVDLPAGGGVTWRFDLWASPRGPCMPPGRYRFRRALDGGSASFVLTLELSLEDP